MTNKNQISTEVQQPRELTVGQQTAIATSDRMMSLIERAASDKEVDVGKLRELLAMQKEIMHDQAQMDANAAFARTCKAMPKIRKNGLIDYGKGKPIPYAKWEDVQDCIRPIYEAEGFTLRHDTTPKEGGGITVTAILTHANGIEFTSSISLPLDTSGGKQNIQGMGSSSSYGKRYSTTNLFNLVVEGDDDDGKTGGFVYITDEQVKNVEDLIIESKTNRDSFLHLIGCTDVQNIQKGELTVVINMLRQKIIQNQKKAEKPV